jgi:hypothetical protein
MQSRVQVIAHINSFRPVAGYDSWCDPVNTNSAGIIPFWLIPFLHCTTSALLEYCQDGRLSMLLPSLCIVCGLEPRRCNP